MNNGEIDLKVMLYRIVKNWRAVIIAAIIAALIAVGYGLSRNLSVICSADRLAAEQTKYESELESWEARGADLHSEENRLPGMISGLIEYNENSPLMQIDPTNEYAGSMTYYVETNYSIMPTATYQNIDYTGRILSAYSDYMSKGKMFEDIADRYGETDKISYLAETVTVSVSASAASVEVTVIGSSRESVEGLLDQISALVSEKTAEFTKTIAEHELRLVNRTVITRPDQSVADIQKEKREELEEQTKKLTEISRELENWEGTKPEFSYSAKKAAKDAVKKLVIGAIVGAFAISIWYALGYALSGRVHEDEAWMCPDMLLFGCYRGDGEKKKRDRRLEERFGYAPSVYDAEECALLIGAGIRNWMKEHGVSSVGVIKTDPTETAEELVASVRKQCGIDISCIGNILSSGSAVSDAASVDAVILTVRENVTAACDVRRVKTLLDAWGKELAGAVCFR